MKSKVSIFKDLAKKLTTSRDVVAVLLEQLSDLPGAISVTDDGRDLSKVLYATLKNVAFMERWVLMSYEHLTPAEKVQVHEEGIECQVSLVDLYETK